MANSPQVVQAMTARATRYWGIEFGRQGVPVRGQQGCPLFRCVGLLNVYFSDSVADKNLPLFGSLHVQLKITMASDHSIA